MRPDTYSPSFLFFTAIALAISRDGSSGGVIRTATINEKGMEKKYTTGDQLPQFFDQ